MLLKCRVGLAKLPSYRAAKPTLRNIHLFNILIKWWATKTRYPPYIDLNGAGNYILTDV